MPNRHKAQYVAQNQQPWNEIKKNKTKQKKAKQHNLLIPKFPTMAQLKKTLLRDRKTWLSNFPFGTDQPFPRKRDQFRADPTFWWTAPPLPYAPTWGVNKKKKKKKKKITEPFLLCEWEQPCEQSEAPQKGQLYGAEAQLESARHLACADDASPSFQSTWCLQEASNPKPFSWIAELPAHICCWRSRPWQSCPQTLLVPIPRPNAREQQQKHSIQGAKTALTEDPTVWRWWFRWNNTFSRLQSEKPSKQHAQELKKQPFPFKKERDKKRKKKKVQQKVQSHISSSVKKKGKCKCQANKRRFFFFFFFLSFLFSSFPHRHGLCIAKLERFVPSGGVDSRIVIVKLFHIVVPVASPHSSRVTTHPEWKCKLEGNKFVECKKDHLNLNRKHWKIENWLILKDYGRVKDTFFSWIRSSQPLSHQSLYSSLSIQILIQ